MTSMSDHDPEETREWLDALDSVWREEGASRAHFLLQQLISRTYAQKAPFAAPRTTPYINSIPVEQEPPFPGDAALERRIRSIMRWNAIAMVLRAGKKDLDLGGHLSSYASAATLYETGFNHFFHAPDADHGGDLIYYQGHSSPGIYARAFLEGRLTEAQLDNFRQEVAGKGLSSYPHPWLMPDFWQFPTVSMGLGPLQAIYQARFLKYLHHRELLNTEHRKVWAFLGDGEMDEPESLGAISLGSREKLDNLIFVVNCNLQRLDGPVRGNGKIIQELEACFRGAGWNVLKLVWGGEWDTLLAQDHDGLLQKCMMETVDGEYQNCKAHGPAYTREHFFGKYPELKARVAEMSDADIAKLNRGGHDPHKVYAVYHAAMQHQGQPTVILAKTVKGYGMGSGGESKNISHQVKKLDIEALKHVRDRFSIPISDDKLAEIPYYKPADDSEELNYLRQRRKQLGGSLPARRKQSSVMPALPLTQFSAQLEGSGDREVSTTMAFVRILNTLLKDKTWGPRIVPIVPDEARTFGMEGMFRQIGIYSSVGQLYKPVDSDQIMLYREDKKGQILEEGINEAGAFCSWIAAATSYSSNDFPMVPFYIYYSMFGFQRVGDLAWAAGDMQARGFLLGATSGRTTLNGEGLQHQDGHSHILASTIPNCVAYDPTYAYELAVIIQHGLQRMYVAQENVFYYITLMNENYAHPAMPKGVEDGIIRGMYLLQEAKASAKLKRVQLLGSGVILREVLAAAQLLAEQFDVAADVWSVTSFNELRKDGLDVERWNRLHPEESPRQSYVAQALEKAKGPVIAATDYMKLFADQIRAFVASDYHVLGTDGFGRSDSRENLRRFFEVDRYYIVVAALAALADRGEIPSKRVVDAIKKYGIDYNKPNPISV